MNEKFEEILYIWGKETRETRGSMAPNRHRGEKNQWLYAGSPPKIKNPSRHSGEIHRRRLVASKASLPFPLLSLSLCPPIALRGRRDRGDRRRTDRFDRGVNETRTATTTQHVHSPIREERRRRRKGEEEENEEGGGWLAEGVHGISIARRNNWVQSGRLPYVTSAPFKPRRGEMLHLSLASLSPHPPGRAARRAGKKITSTLSRKREQKNGERLLASAREEEGEGERPRWKNSEQKTKKKKKKKRRRRRLEDDSRERERRLGDSVAVETGAKDQGAGTAATRRDEQKQRDAHTPGLETKATRRAQNN